jgi:hypothetical protein
MPIDPSMMFGVRELQPNSEMKTYFKIDVKRRQTYVTTNDTRRELLQSCENESHMTVRHHVATNSEEHAKEKCSGNQRFNVPMGYSKLGFYANGCTDVD